MRTNLRISASIVALATLMMAGSASPTQARAGHHVVRCAWKMDIWGSAYHRLCWRVVVHQKKRKKHRREATRHHPRPERAAAKPRRELAARAVPARPGDKPAAPLRSSPPRVALPPWPDEQLARAIDLTRDETAVYAVPAYRAPAIVGFIEKAVGDIFRGFWSFLVAHRPEAPTDRLPKLLQTKLLEIQNACAGFKAVSTRCNVPGGHSLYVRGTRTVSLHCVDKAADFVVASWACARPFLTLARWKGGANRDPEIVRHFHVSLGGREDGVRFCHRGKNRDGSCVGSIHHAAEHRRVRVAHLSPYRHARSGG